MRILHLNNEKDWGGGERQVLLLATALQQRGLKNVIGCRPGSPLADHAVAHNITTHPFSGNLFRALFDAVMAARDCDLIHSHTGRAHSLGTVAARLSRKPMVVTRRIDRLPHNGWFERMKYRRAAQVVCISRYIAGQVEDWGVPREKLPVVYSAVPITPVPAERPPLERLCAGLNLSPANKVVGNIGSLVSYKDHATLLGAAALLTGKRDDVIFLILGDGVLRNELRAMALDLGLEKKVFFAGFVPRAEQWLPVFDVLAVSSRREGLGSIVLDAFAAGVPVVATTAGGLPEMVRDGDTGLLAPVGDAAGLADAILRLLENPALATRLSSAARDWAERECSVERMADGYLEVYRRILSR